MRIGVMLRHFGEPGGIGVYTVNILKALFQIDQKNHYVLIYRYPQNVGSFSDFPNVMEKVVSAPNTLWWDQVSIPRFAKRECLDLIYNPKLSVPFFTRCKTILVMHGAEQFAVPHAFKWYDRIYFSMANQLYCKKASAIIAMTHCGSQDISKYMGADPKKMHVIYEAYNENCCVLERERTHGMKKKYHLPEHFIFFLGGINPIKNFGNLLRSYEKIQKELPHKLVVAGFKRWKFSKDLELLDRLGLRDKVVFLGFVPDEDVPVIYNLADLFVFPSLYEGFGMPVLEAMACGCPVITSQTGCSPEIAGGAALLVDPYMPEQIAEAIRNVLTEETLKEQLIAKGLKRVQHFGWQKCAKETLELFELVYKDSM